MGSETETILINRRSAVQQTTDNEKLPITNLSSNDKTEFFGTSKIGNNFNNFNNNTISSNMNYFKKQDSKANITFSSKIDEDEDEIVHHHHHHNNSSSNSSSSNSSSSSNNHKSALPDVGTDLTFKRKIVWFNAIGFLLLHIIGITGMLSMVLGYAKPATIVYFLFLTFASGMGITAGAHRLFSHRSYKAKLWLRVTLLLLHTMAGQNCLYVWVRDHRQHHKFSDTDADPHNATRGFFFSHVGWLMSRKHPKVIEYGKKIDMSDLEADPWVMFQKKYYKTLYFVFVIYIPTLLPVYFWGENLYIALWTTYFGRTILQLNFTWSVNSVAHMFGNKPYDKNMLPVESRLVAFFAGGEGWHNYHHTFPFDYRAAELGMPLNITTRIIDYFAKYGHIYDRKSVTNEMLRNRIQRTGDGSHEKYGIKAMQTMTSTDETLVKEVDCNNYNIIKNNQTQNTNLTSTNNILINKNNSNNLLQKYIIDKNEMNKIHMLDKNEKNDDLNNNYNKNKYTDLATVKDLNRLVVENQTFKQPINKQALNVCSS